MARKATGAQIALAYVAETTWGTTPTSPAMKELRAISETVDFVKGTLVSQELKPTRQIGNVIHGTHGVEGNIECEFTNALDDWLEAAFYSSFSSGILKIGQILKQFTLERRLISIGQMMRYVGVRPNGFKLSLAPEQIAKISFPIQGKTMTTAIDGLGGPNAWLINNGAGYSAGATTVAIDTGSINPAAEDQFVIYQAGSSTLMRSDQVYTVASYAAPNLTFSPGLDVAILDNDILHFVRPATAVTSDDPTNAFSGVLQEGGSTVAIVTGIDMELGQGGQAAKVIGSNQPQAIIEGGVSLSGTLKLYVQDFSLFNKFVNENYSTLQFQLVGVNTYTFLLPKTKYNGGKINKPADGGPIIQEVPFVAVYDATEATVIKVTKT